MLFWTKYHGRITTLLNRYIECAHRITMWWLTKRMLPGVHRAFFIPAVRIGVCLNASSFDTEGTACRQFLIHPAVDIQMNHDAIRAEGPLSSSHAMQSHCSRWWLGKVWLHFLQLSYYKTPSFDWRCLQTHSSSSKLAPSANARSIPAVQRTFRNNSRDVHPSTKPSLLDKPFRKPQLFAIRHQHPLKEGALRPAAHFHR